MRSLGAVKPPKPKALEGITVGAATAAAATPVLRSRFLREIGAFFVLFSIFIPFLET
jgi:hypothetical protein